MITVWRGTYTDVDGKVTRVEIRADGDALARWFGRSGHSRAAFAKGKTQPHTTKRLGGGLVIHLRPGREVKGE